MPAQCMQLQSVESDIKLESWLLHCTLHVPLQPTSDSPRGQVCRYRKEVQGLPLPLAVC